MAILLVGLILFLGIHSVHLVAPTGRASMHATLGERPYKSLYSVVSLVGFGLIIWGFSRASEQSAILYSPPEWTVPAAAVLMVPALILVLASVVPPGRIKHAVMHPLLYGTILWAVAHLIVNGDAAGVVLFGAFLVWAVIDLLAQPRIAGSAAGLAATRSDLIAVVGGLVLYGAFVWKLHFWLFGVAPLP